MLQKISLSGNEINAINSLLDDLENVSANHREEFSFASNAEILAQELPRRIREIFHKFKSTENQIGILIENGSHIIWDIPDTPSSYLEKPLDKGDLILTRSDMAHMLFSWLLWTPFGFRTQRYGHIVNTIIAQKESENVSNNSAGSRYDFWFHTEDAFHLASPNHLGLLCMRNEEKAPTTISHVNIDWISNKLLDELFQENFLVTSNNIHKNVIDTINKTRKSIFFWNKEHPYFRINENTLDLTQYSLVQQEALWWILDQLYTNRIDVVLESGNFLYIDNFRTAHRRDAYEPNYWPHMRWLKRIVTTNDLTKSSALRKNPDSLIIENI